MTRHILSQQFTADTLTPGLKINTPCDRLREGKPLSPLTHVYLTPSRPLCRYCALSAVRSGLCDVFTTRLRSRTVFKMKAWLQIW